MNLKHYLALASLPGLSTKELSQCVEHLSQIENLFTLDKTALEDLKIPLRIIAAIKNVDWPAMEAILTWEQQSADHHLITLNCKTYPTFLRNIVDPPPLLYAIGNVSLLNSTCLAMVGSRNASQNGLDKAYDFAQQLAKKNITIVSGLAQGIDSFAHRGAIDVKGNTIAVMGTGINKRYPYKNKGLAQAISQIGLLLTEFPLNSPAKAYHFPKRNRIISGLSHAVFVIEATLKSGSLITARLALEQGRDVFALPCSIDNPMSKGCHHLIKEGAKLIDCLEDILVELPLSPEIAQKESKIETNLLKRLDVSTKSLVEFVGYEITPIHQIVEASDLSPETVNCQLVELELQGQIKSVMGGYMRTKI